MSLKLLFFLSLLYGSYVSSTQLNSSASNASVLSSLHVDPLVEVLFRFSGFIELGRPNARFFYYYFPKRDDEYSVKTPLILWLMGRPGLSTNVALFHEIGPFEIEKDLTLEYRRHGWDKEANIIFVDEPIGTGHSRDDDHIQNHEFRHGDEIAQDLFTFLQVFFKTKFPPLRKNPLFIIGQTYAGKYAPKLATLILRENKLQVVDRFINLKGVAMGNSFTHPLQYITLLDSVVELGLISFDNISVADDNILRQLRGNCLWASKDCDKHDTNDECLAAYTGCAAYLQNIKRVCGGINILDYTKGKSSYDFSDVARFLNANPIENKRYEEFVIYDDDIFSTLMSDYMRNGRKDVIEVLESGTSILIYAGENDVVCNWIGNWNWVKEMKWNGNNNIQNGEETPLMDNDEDSGRKTTHGPLTFIRIPDAGHFVPMDRPEVALYMIKDWMDGAMRDPK